MRNRAASLAALFATVALTAGCDTISIPTIDVASWFGDSTPAAPQAAPTEKVQADPLPAQAAANLDAAKTDAPQPGAAQTDTAQNLPIDGMQREDLRGAFGVDDKVEAAPSNRGL
jgi:hypothetical protein